MIKYIHKCTKEYSQDLSYSKIHRREIANQKQKVADQKQ
jgi:hypothetical protein